MDTDFLDSFVAVVEGGSIAEAARRLNLTPAAVALRIRTLEKEFGAKLLIRSGRTVTPTEAGWAIVDLGRRLLRDVRDMRAVATVGSFTGELRIGAVPTAITGLMPKILTTLQDVHPGMEIHIVPGQSAELYSKVLSGELDGAVIIEPYFEMSKACGWAVLREEPLLVIVPSSMAGADADSVLRSEPFIRYGRSFWGGRLVDNYLSRVGSALSWPPWMQSQCWWTGDWACRSFPIGRRPGRKACPCQNCRFPRRRNRVGLGFFG